MPVDTLENLAERVRMAKHNVELAEAEKEKAEADLLAASRKLGRLNNEQADAVKALHEFIHGKR